MRQALEGLKIKAFFAFNLRTEATRASGARSLDNKKSSEGAFQAVAEVAWLMARGIP